MKNILFVDDEVKVLDGLRRMLRPMRREWNMAFCSSGQDALDKLDAEPFDVVVSDMRMPGMDGAALLKEVMRRHPHTVRIILSGQSSQEATIRLVGVAHQFLAKPCDAETLRQTVNRAFAVHGLLSNGTLKGVLSQMTTIPSIPALYTQLMDELQYPDASTKRIGAIIAQDPGMTAKILQLVNSAFFGIPRHVAGPVEAASLLGTDIIKTLVLSVHLFSQFDGVAVAGITPESVQKHCSKTATIAKNIAAAEKCPRETVDASLMAGFLHDIGRLVLANNYPQQYREVMARVEANGVGRSETELALLGATHAQVGAYLLGLWGLPYSIVEAAAFHHCPAEACGQSFSPLTAVHVADALVHECGGTCHRTNEAIDLDYLAHLGLADRLPVWRETCRAHLRQGGVA